MVYALVLRAVNKINDLLKSSINGYAVTNPEETSHSNSVVKFQSTFSEEEY